MPHRSSRSRRIVFAFAAFTLSGAIGIALVEGALRLLRDPARFTPYHKNSVRVFYPSEAITPGITGTSFFTTNSLGTRGPEPDGEAIRILTVGGSTTACTVLDDAETWPALLREYLNEGEDERRVWITNSGIDGHNSQHHLMHARYFLPQIPDLDYVIVYTGLNDVGMWLFHEDYDSHFLDDPANWNHRLAQAFRVSNYTPRDWPWYKHLELWKRLSVAKSWFLSRRVAREREEGRIAQDVQLQWMQDERARRQERQKSFVHRAKMETLPAALDSYARNLEQIAAYAREAGVEPIFVAQAIQHQFLDEEERRRFWMGAMEGGATYVKEEQMLELLEAHNARMREVAAKRAVVFIDLPELLRGERDVFYDGVHFNEHGARVTARALAKELRSTVFADPGA